MKAPVNVAGLRSALRGLRKKLARPRLLRNVFRASHPKRALLCHVTYPFRTPDQLLHTQYQEAHGLANALHARSFQVDVLDYDHAGTVSYNEYDVLLGFGRHVRNCFQCRRSTRPKVILYSPGIHNHEQNRRTLQRVRDFHDHHGVWLLESGRFADDDWTSLAILADGVLVLGNESVAETYRRHTDRPVMVLPGFYQPVLDPSAVAARREIRTARRHALWFGSTGLIHKGLDLALDAVTSLPDWHLHVCGPLHRETSFMQCFQTLHGHPRIHLHGFVRLSSPAFATLLQQCTFSLSPSCSEGGAAALLNTIGNGGLIPVATRETGVDIDPFGITIQELSPSSLAAALTEADALTEDMITERCRQALDWAKDRHSWAAYQRQLDLALNALL